MSVVTEIQLNCDGGDSCPLQGAEATERNSSYPTASAYRNAMHYAGWLHVRRHGGLDFCPACRKTHPIAVEFDKRRRALGRVIGFNS